MEVGQIALCTILYLCRFRINLRLARRAIDPRRISLADCVMIIGSGAGVRAYRPLLRSHTERDQTTLRGLCYCWRPPTRLSLIDISLSRRERKFVLS